MEYFTCSFTCGIYIFGLSCVTSIFIFNLVDGLYYADQTSSSASHGKSELMFKTSRTCLCPRGFGEGNSLVIPEQS